MFQCELCGKEVATATDPAAEMLLRCSKFALRLPPTSYSSCCLQVKHTRNIIGAHMKMVHLISWKEYQDVILKLKSGKGTVRFSKHLSI